MLYANQELSYSKQPRSGGMCITVCKALAAAYGRSMSDDYQAPHGAAYSPSLWRRVVRRDYNPALAGLHKLV